MNRPLRTASALAALGLASAGHAGPFLRMAGMDADKPVVALYGSDATTFTMQSSSDLLNWDSVGQLRVSKIPEFWIDPAALEDSPRFYRARMEDAGGAPGKVSYFGAGTAAASTGPVTPGLPADLVPGDLLILFLETAGDNICVADGNGGTWLALARDAASPQSCGTGTSEVHLTAYYSRYNGRQGAPTTSDSGDHQLGRIHAFRGVVSHGVPWDVVDGTTESANDTTGFTPGATTTVPGTLVVGAIATALPDAEVADNFFDWVNFGGISDLTERSDDSTAAGNGGALGVVTGDYSIPGKTYSRINVTLANPSYKAMFSVALRPERPPAGIADAWPADGAGDVGLAADLRWTAGPSTASCDVYFGTAGPGEYMGSQVSTTFDPGPLQPGTTYYWRVDQRNAAGTTTGAVRSFTTRPSGSMPQLAGMTLANALQEIEAAGCSAGVITRVWHDLVPAGVVTGQSPAAGSPLVPGATVDLIRSRGPEAGVVVFPNGPDFLDGEAIPVHRCVSLVTSQAGTLLAFTEHRTNSAADEDDMDIHLRRSTDGGETWGPVIVVADDNMNPCKNQVPVVLPSGRILVLWLWNEWIPKETDRKTRRVKVTWSDDDGLTWAPHRDITDSVYRDNWSWYGAGPGHAFIKTREPHVGRIIFPNRHGVVGAPGTAHIIYSDDNGETFHLGGDTRIGNESIACEQSDGDILLNARVESDYRFAAISRDGGLTWAADYYDTQLLAAGKCQGSILEHSMNPATGKANILFSNPDDLYERVNGTVKLSENDGDLGTWVKEFRYSDPFPAFSGYSDIAVINAAGDVGIIWEFGSHYSKPARWDGGVKFRAIRFDQISVPYE